MDINTILLIFFAIPFAIILFSIAIQKLIRNPFLVAGIIFSVLLIIVLAFFDPIYLILVIVYTILSFLTAVITKWIRKLLKRFCTSNDSSNTELQVGEREELISVSNANKQLIKNEINNNTDFICSNNRCRQRYKKKDDF